MIQVGYVSIVLSDKDVGNSCAMCYKMLLSKETIEGIVPYPQTQYQTNNFIGIT